MVKRKGKTNKKQAHAEPKAFERKGSDQRAALWIVALPIVLLTLLVYLPALDNQFVNWDDPQVILDNRYIRSITSESLEWMFTSFNTGNWIPLTRLSHAMAFSLFGPNPKMHHLVNVALHGLNTLVVFYLFSAVLKLAGRNSRNDADSPAKRYHVEAAALGALVFGLHPLHVESVAWVAERKGLLCELFFILSLLSYLRYVDKETHGIAELGTCLFFFILALMSKPMAVSLPVVLLILDGWPLNRLKGKISFVFLEKVPFFVVSFIFGVIAIKAQASSGAMVATDIVSPGFRVMNAFHSIIFYLSKLLLPINLVPFYPIVNPAGSAFSGANLFCAVLVIFISGVCVFYAFKKQSYLLAAWLYYLITVGPVLGILQVGSQAAANRYAYLPTLSITLLLAQGIVFLIFTLKWRSKTEWVVKPALVVMVAGGLIFYGSITVKQIKVWHNSVSLWEHVIRSFPDVSNIAHTNLANAYREAGRYNDAVNEYKRGLAIALPHPYTLNGLGCVYLDRGQVDKAIEAFERAVDLDSGYATAYRNLWFAYNRCGMAKEALAAVQKAIQLDPDFGAAYSNLGISLGNLGKSEESEQAFLKAVALEPDNPEFLANLATTYQRAGRLDEAIELYQKAVKKNPRNPIYLMNLGNTYLSKERFKPAMILFNTVINLEPKNSLAYAKLGETQEKVGDVYEAVKSFRNALELNPEMVQAYLGLARIYDKLNEPEKAKEHYRKAQELKTGRIRN